MSEDRASTPREELWAQSIAHVLAGVGLEAIGWTGQAVEPDDGGRFRVFGHNGRDDLAVEITVRVYPA